MKYWGILAAKLLVAGGVLYAVWLGLHAWYELPAELARFNHKPFGQDLQWTTLMFFYNLLVNGVLFLILYDQKYRCRTCGRRLRMPIRTGSHAHVLFKPPKTEYICTYGHGTLRVPELQISGRENPDWQPHGEDIWKELFQAGPEKKN
jgi:hypothetical protein